jgi:DNA-binding MarR family transcriptional regulator
MPLSDMDIATRFRSEMYRLLKVLRKETRNDELLSLTERSTLALIYQHTEILPGELAAMEKVTTQGMSQIINHLLEMGYILKTPSDEDRRKVIVTLTEAGRKLVRQRQQEKQEWLSRRISEELNAKQKQTLTDAIDILTKLIG